MAAVIRDQLAKLSPENADLYTRNAQQLTETQAGGYLDRSC